MENKYIVLLLCAMAMLAVAALLLVVVGKNTLPDSTGRHATAIPCVEWEMPSEANMMAQCKSWAEPPPPAKYRITGWRNGKYFEIETNGPAEELGMGWLEWIISEEK